MLPHQLACRASALLVCHDPGKIGTPSRCCPEQAEFWRLGRASWRPAYQMGCGWNELRPVAVRKHLLNHNREIKRAGSVIAPPAHAISKKNKHLLVVYSTPTRGFTAAVSVFMGTPPAKPLICKSVSNQLGALWSDLWADPTGEEFCILCAIFSFVLSDIIETSF